LAVFNIAELAPLGPNRSAYETATPFPHAIIDGFLPEPLALEIEASFPSPESDIWWRYENPLEKKLACNEPGKLPAVIRETLEKLNSAEVCRLLTSLTGIEGLQADPGLHGGGLHCIRSGGKLDVHVDYSIHPKLQLERRLNLIIYLNRDWPESYGGHLELWDASVSRCEKRVLPIFNRAVIFNTGDGSYHGHPEPLACPPDRARKSLALYYLTPPRPGATERFKARFVKRPSDPDDPELEQFRRRRADPNAAAATYRSDGTAEPK
jgi:hypothetical protein